MPPSQARAEPRVVVNASLLDDVELSSDLPSGVEVWTPGGVRPQKPMIPSKVDLWMPDGLKGPRPLDPGQAALRRTLPPARAQQATMLLPIAKKRHRHKGLAALSVAALIAALAMLVGVLAWRHWRKTAPPMQDEVPAKVTQATQPTQVTQVTG